MGTRGIIGFHIDGKDILSYNHFDSYPSSLGLSVATFIKNCSGKKNWIEDLRNKVLNLDIVKEGSPIEVHPYLRKKLSKANISIEKHKEKRDGSFGKVNWYDTLRSNQGDLEGILNTGIILEGNDFILDSLFCEYGYIINLDSMEVEFYEGFIRRNDPCKGRYSSHMPPEKEYGLRQDGTKYEIDIDYRACSLSRSYPLTKDGMVFFFNEMNSSSSDGGYHVTLTKDHSNRQILAWFKPFVYMVYLQSSNKRVMSKNYTFEFNNKTYITQGSGSCYEMD